MSDFNSQYWIPFFKNLATAMYSRIQNAPQYLAYRPEMFEHIEKQYKSRLPRIKKDMFSDDITPESRIDRHKVIALYVQLFLENQPFVLRKTETAIYPSAVMLILNETLCLHVIRGVIKKWYGKTVDNVKFAEYEIALIKLLSAYKESHTTLDKVKPHFHFTHALAHVIYFIERDFT